MGIQIVVYIAGMCIYLGFQKFKKWLNKRNDLKFQERKGSSWLMQLLLG